MEDRNTYKRFNVPFDVLTDVVKIIIDNELKNEITGANENKSFIELSRVSKRIRITSKSNQ
ncbi:MAG: hypothetical protein IPJ32_18485 [Sphingobacteriaceae bacterium]|nr:hypothetical protein [Sphingobacteriaceae bacterium]